MDFDLSSDQRMLVDTVTAFVRKDSPISRFRALREDEHGVGWDPAVLRKMGELGWLGIPFPESVGGLGWRCIDLALVLEPLGAALVPEPILASAMLGGLPVARAGSEEQQGRWLPSAIAGESILALAWMERIARDDAHHVTTRAAKAAKGWSLSGEKRWVLAGHAAQSFVVSARTAGNVDEQRGVSLFVVDRDMPGVRVQPAKTIDGHRAATLILEDVSVGDDRRLGGDDEGSAALDWTLDFAAACACAEGLGIMTAVLQMTRDYLCQREQFGVKIGTFQALQHRCVDMFVETELAKSTMILGALSMDEQDDARRRRGVSAAKVQLATGGRLVTQQSIQLHGGIGITDEHDVGLFFKRMHALNALFGDEDWHLRRFASLPGFAPQT